MSGNGKSFSGGKMGFEICNLGVKSLNNGNVGVGCLGLNLQSANAGAKLGDSSFSSPELIKGSVTVFANRAQGTCYIVLSSSEAEKSFVQMFQCYIHIIVSDVPLRKTGIKIYKRGYAIENQKSTGVSGDNWTSGGYGVALDSISHFERKMT